MESLSDILVKVEIEGRLPLILLEKYTVQFLFSKEVIHNFQNTFSLYGIQICCS